MTTYFRTGPSRPLPLSPFLLCVLLACLPFAARAQDPVLGNSFAHDPGTMIKEGSRYYVFYTGFALPYKYSTDRTNWTWNSSQRVFPAGPPAWVATAIPGFDENYWAPDIAYFNGKFHLYYSASIWGTIDSVIGLVTTPTLNPPVWTDQGKVIQSDASCCTQPETDLTANNCIDPAILVRTNGDVWMVFGSYSDGILLMQLDPATGKRLNTNTAPTKVASSTTAFFANTTEGAMIHERNGYFYLFNCYGGCCSGVESTYNIRVGRSANITGPYLDKNGVTMLNGGGSLLLDSTGKYVGPGHPAIYVEGATNWFTYHYYDANNNGTATLGLTRLYWDTNNWPAVTNDWSAFYPLDVDARDHRGNFSGNLSNGATTTNDPARGRVLALDGATNLATLKFPVANASTFATWVKWNGGADWQHLFDFGSNTVRYFFLTPRTSTGKLRFAIRNGGSEQTVDAPMALPTNSWCHVAVTLDGARGTLFLNGSPVATNNSMTLRPWQVQARSNYVGKSQFTNDPPFSGQIDSFRAFGRVLGASEIRDLAWAHPALAHRYSFNGDARDSIGMAHGLLKGNATITNNALQLTGATGGYVNLPGGLVSQCSAVSFEFWATFGVNANWARVFDFGNSSGGNGSQYVFFSPHTASSSQRFQLSTSSGTFTRDPTNTLDNRTVHVVCTLDRTNNYAAIYTNGVLQTLVTTNLPPLTGVSANYGYIGRSMFSTDGWLNATIDEFRIYHGRLTPQEITANFTAGPDALALPVNLDSTNNGPTLTLNWPAYAVGFVPQATTNIAGAWSSLALPALPSNDRWQLTLPTTNDARFFRLRR